MKRLESLGIDVMIGRCRERLPVEVLLDLVRRWTKGIYP